MPRSIYNSLLFIALAVIARVLLITHLEQAIKAPELLALAGFSASGALVFRYLPLSGRHWVENTLARILTSRSSSALLIALLLASAVPLIGLAQETYIWRGPVSLEIQRNGKNIRLDGDPDVPGRFVRRFTLAWQSVKVTVRGQEFNLRPIPFRDNEIHIPFHLVAGDVPEVKEIEELLSLVLFQWDREGLLDDVGRSLVSFEEREILPPEQTRRLLDLHKILSLTFDEREKDDSTRLKRITERFSKRYPHDPWDAVARASQQYEERNYSKAATILLEVPSFDSPPASATDFFRALCLLQAHRNSRDEDSDGSEREALDLLRNVGQRLREEARSGSSFAAVAHPSALIYEGIVHFYGARWTAAISAFDGATHSDDANLRARALNGLGFVHFIMGDLYKAELYLTRALEVDRTFVTARLNLGYVELAKGQHFLARKIFRGVQEDWKGDRSHRYFVLGQLGRAHSEQTIYETSERALDEQLVELYADALRFWRLDDYEHISPLHVRLAHIQEAVALKIYRDPQLYGLDIMSLVMLVRAQRLLKHPTGSSLTSELRGRIDAAIQEVIPKVNEEWIEKRPRAAFFLPLGDLGDGVLDQRRET